VMRVHVNPDAWRQFNVSSSASPDYQDGMGFLRGDALTDRLALGTRALAVYTDTFGRVPVDVEILEAPSTLPLDNWDHVVEASIDVASGRLAVLEYVPDEEWMQVLKQVTTVEVVPGNYVVRVFSRGLSRYYDEGTGRGAGRKPKGDEYLLQFWRGPVTERQVLKCFPKRERLSSRALGCLVLAALFIGCGVWSVVRPTDMYVFHPNYGPPIVTGPSPPAEHVTTPADRVFGVLWLALGAGIGWAALCRPRRDFWL
jgi:hypothetical protein